MKTHHRILGCAALASALLLQMTSPAHAIPIGTVVAVPGSTAAPPPTLGTFTMTPFATDARLLSQVVTSVPSPLGGNVSFSLGLTHLAVANGWATWSNGYTGAVYYDTGTTLTLTLPQYTEAFYFYVEPNCDDSGTPRISAIVQDGTTLTESVVSNNGASFFGFYTTGAQTIQTITINVPALAHGFGIGEMGIATRGNPNPAPVPEPGTWVMGSALFGVAATRLLRRKLS